MLSYVLVVMIGLESADSNLSRWHAGLIKYGNDWVPFQSVVKETPRAYVSLLSKNLTTASGQVQLAELCTKLNLKEEARGHYTVALAFDPKQPQAQRALGRILRQGKWATPEEHKNEPKRRAAIAKKQKAWRDRFFAIKNWDIELAEIELDSTAIQVLELFTIHDELCARATVHALARHDFDPATFGLLRQALHSEFSQVRTEAVQSLSSRNLNHVLPHLISLLRPPVMGSNDLVVTDHIQKPTHDNSVSPDATTYRWSTTNWYFRSGLGTHNFFGIEERVAIANRLAEGKRTQDNFQTWVHQTSTVGGTRDIFTVPDSGNRRRPSIFLDTDPEVGISRVEEQWNRVSKNAYTALKELTGQSLENDWKAWSQWYADWSHSTFDESKPIDSKSLPAFLNGEPIPSTIGDVTYVTSITQVLPMRHTCFAAGTLVHTKRGIIPIEEICVGELVLSQSEETGELAYKPVRERTLRKTSKMRALTAGNDTIVATLVHPIWVEGSGWKKVVELGEGDILRTASGHVTLDQTRDAEQGQAFNLVIDEFNTYFVGKSAILVHDDAPIWEHNRPAPGAPPLKRTKSAH